MIVILLVIVIKTFLQDIFYNGHRYVILVTTDRAFNIFYFHI